MGSKVSRICPGEPDEALSGPCDAPPAYSELAGRDPACATRTPFRLET